jgi:hypothetical protein
MEYAIKEMKENSTHTSKHQPPLKARNMRGGDTVQCQVGKKAKHNPKGSPHLPIDT